ncbi:anti-sigma factor family protein [Elusimicrobiota bacterium]
MDHEKMKDVLFEYADNEVSQKERDMIDAHLVQCRDCRDILKEMHETQQAFFPKPDVSRCEALTQRIMAEIDAQTQDQPTLVSRLKEIFSWEVLLSPRVVLKLAGAIAVVVMIFLLKPEIQQPTVVEINPEIEYVIDLMDGPFKHADNGYSDIGTSIEEYFL